MFLQKEAMMILMANSTPQKATALTQVYTLLPLPSLPLPFTGCE